ncbi:TniQ family protein [Bosea lathyri]|uniref:TniQ protein n=1 Tax=Bosea lathyri TaxID=1036778 RepID=A0A1H6CA64_9HYPH|nr:TniQ family protein [Bosea lathyri]SEG69246.1 TniQ protein [Bosea lathyri]
MRLYPTLPLLLDEAPVSYISRLALLHGFHSARAFANQMGVHSERLADGDVETLALLSDLSGAPAIDLARSAVVKVGSNYQILGQALAKKESHKARICPRCVAEDLGPYREGWRTGVRFQWQLGPLRCCRRHDIVLVELERKPSQRLFDCASTLQPEFGKILGMADAARMRPASPLEEYLTARVAGAATSPWLDALPWYAAAKVSEMVGALLIDGKEAHTSAYTPEQWIAAGAAGFAVTSMGADAVYAALDRARQAVDSPTRNPHLHIWFGRFFLWIKQLTDHGAYDPLREILLDIAKANIALGPEDHIFGRQVVERRRLHSISSARSHTGLGSVHLRRKLASAGFISPDHKRHIDPRLLLQATPELEEFLEKARHSLTQPEAAKYLNASSVQMKILVKEGLIRPFQGQEELRNRSYDRRALDTFLQEFEEGAELVEQPSFPLLSIPAASRLSNCSAGEIVQALRDGRLSWKGKAAGKRGYGALLVNYEQARQVLFKASHDALVMPAACQVLSSTRQVMVNLIKIGAIDARRVTLPRQRTQYTLVSRASLNKFMRDYVSLTELASEHRRWPIHIKKVLRGLAIPTAFEKSEIGATFYRRRDVPAALGAHA